MSRQHTENLIQPNVKLEITTQNAARILVAIDYYNAANAWKDLGINLLRDQIEEAIIKAKTEIKYTEKKEVNQG